MGGGDIVIWKGKVVYIIEELNSKRYIETICDYKLTRMRHELWENEYTFQRDDVDTP